MARMPLFPAVKIEYCIESRGVDASWNWKAVNVIKA